jgi:tetratricopeptide (TPR) repeat protein
VAVPAKPPPPALLRNTLLPLSILVAMVVYYGARLPFAAAAGSALPFLLLYALGPRWARASVASFDRDVVVLLMRKDAAALNARFNRALGLRFFAAPAVVAERRGLVEAQRGRHAAARDAYREALEGYGTGAPLAVLLGLAHACFERGLTDEAITAYEKVLARSKTLPLVQENLAQLYVKRGTPSDLKAARKLRGRY